MLYIHWRYIPRLFRWLTKEYKLCLSVIELRSSVIIGERVLVSCSGNHGLATDMQLEG
jgi:hypothetical protein